MISAPNLGSVMIILQFVHSSFPKRMGAGSAELQALNKNIESSDATLIPALDEMELFFIAFFA